MHLLACALRAPLVGLDDVEAEHGLEDAADFARLEREGRVLEGLDHHAAPEPAKVAAFAFAARVFGELVGELHEVFARADAREYPSIFARSAFVSYSG